MLENYCIRLGRYVKSEGGNGCKVLAQIRLPLYSLGTYAMLFPFNRQVGAQSLRPTNDYEICPIFCYFDGTSQRKIIPPGVLGKLLEPLVLASVFPSGVNANSLINPPPREL